MKEILLSVLIAVVAYLLGSISTGTFLSKSKGIDIRAVGSHNPGASNVLRTMGFKYGLLTFLGDALKAALACLLGLLLLPEAFGISRFGVLLGGLFVVIGHNWSVFYRFRGGKGVACSSAVILFVHPLCGAIAIAVCLLVVWIFRYISVGSMTMMLVFLIGVCIARSPWPVCVLAALLFVLCVFRHRSNISRIIHGTENKLGKKK